MILELLYVLFYFSRIVVDPKNEDIVVKGGLSGSISRDGGKTFKSLGNMHSDIHDIVFSIKDSDIMYVGTDGGVYRTWDGGTTMEIVENMPLSQFYHISVDDAELITYMEDFRTMVHGGDLLLSWRCGRPAIGTR